MLGLGASSAASKAKIICQQCLTPGHWTYECKNGSTYQARASATKQLRQKRFRQAHMEEEAPAIPENNFLGDDRLRNKPKEPPAKIQKTDDDKKKKKKKKKEESSSSSSSSSDSDSDSSSSSSS
eukprot:TRINITY_DN5475_c0_g3_i1.p1 TRINITY_DN5475_c0_g3~~TRINITY_DN5475_c0_g3_i1.p1  ORF type:complete len:124 (-),score=32.53 TRINITY_DN5475_c0_g3_i1:160-531(-)